VRIREVEEHTRFKVTYSDGQEMESFFVSVEPTELIG